MADILDFVLNIENIPPHFFRIVYLDSQNDGIAQDVVFKINCFGRDQLDISRWALKKAKIYYKNNLLFSGLLISGNNYDTQEYNGFYYEFILASPLYLFKTVGANRVFVNKTPEEIINAVFLSRGWKSSQWRWKLDNNLPVLALRAQYNQTDYDFIMELLAECNLYFIFDQGILNIADNIKLLNKSYKYRTHHVKEHEKYRCKNYAVFLGYDFQPRSKINLLKAKIEGIDANFPHLDHQGYYYIKFLFDETSGFLQGSPPIAVISPGFMNFTLRPGTEVAVRFIDGDINRPVIAGVFIDEFARQPDKYIQKSHSGHEFRLSPQEIKISHANRGNSINLAENIIFESQYGDIQAEAGENAVLNASGDFIQDIGKDKLVNIQKNLYVKSSNINFTANKNISFSAEYKIMLKNHKNMIFKNKISNINSEDINIMGKNKIELISQKDMVLLGNKKIIGEIGQSIIFQAAGASIIGSVGGLFLNTAVLRVNAQEITGVPMVGL